VSKDNRVSEHSAAGGVVSQMLSLLKSGLLATPQRHLRLREFATDLVKPYF
jgi:hypothetical protein